MHSFSEVSKTMDGEIPNQIELVRELLSYDMLCPASCVFDRNELGALRFAFAPSPLHWSRQFEWPWAIHHSELQPHHHVLDIGGGWSVLKYAVAKRCRHVISLEPNKEFIDKTELSIEKVGIKNIMQIQGDVRSIPFPDNSFDRVFCISVLEHVEGGHAKGMREMLRVLKPGGALLLTLDIAYSGKDKGDFYMDADSVSALCSEYNIPIPDQTPPLMGAKVPNLAEDICIFVFMARLVK